MKITVIQVGKTRQKHFIEAENEYFKRLKPDLELKIITIKEYSIPAGKKEAAKQIVKAKEGEEILKKIPKNSYVIALDGHGKQLSSVEFADFLKEKRDFTGQNITFIIGGCYGLDKAILNKAEKVISFSKFTFTHEIIRILLLEQLYRSFTIIKGKTYHY